MSRSAFVVNRWTRGLCPERNSMAKDNIAKKAKNISERVAQLIRGAVEECGCMLWDVELIKEGADLSLVVSIDKPGGVSLEDCEMVNDAINPIIDEADPIDGSYYLEVCSPGIDRELNRPHHFEYALGKEITVKLFKAIDGKKEFTGVLQNFDGGITLLVDDEEIHFEKGAFSKVYIFEEI